jgi:hypothetical protein
VRTVAIAVAAALLVGGAVAVTGTWDDDKARPRASSELAADQAPDIAVVERDETTPSKGPARKGSAPSTAPPKVAAAQIGAKKKITVSSTESEQSTSSPCSGPSAEPIEPTPTATHDGGAAPTPPTQSSEDATPPSAPGAPTAAEQHC